MGDRLIMDEARLYRKYQNTLLIAGQSVIMLCIWSMIKLFMYLTVDREYIYELMGDYTDEPMMKTISTIVLVIIFSVDSFIHYKMGSKSIAIAKGDRLSIFYIILMLVYVISTLVLLPNSYNFSQGTRLVEDISSLILDLFSCALLITIIYSSFWVNRYRKEHSVIIGVK